MKKILLAALAVLLLAGCLAQVQKEFEYRNGLVHYELKAPKVINETITANPIDNHSVTKIFFQGRQAAVPGLLRQPDAGKDNHVAIVLLSGAAVKKEPEDASVGKLLAAAGFTVFSIDQRGVGDSAFRRNDTADFDEFKAGNETIAHFMIADALQAALLLDSKGFKKVVVMGESMGGRNALVAAALSGRPAVALSAAGYGSPEGYPEEVRAFIKSIDPTTYAPLLKRTAMLQSERDSMVPFNSALGLYAAVGGEKQFVQINCDHGYCDAAADKTVAAAEWAAGLEG